jgi:hypothetical protein
LFSRDFSPTLAAVAVHLALLKQTVILSGSPESAARIRGWLLQMFDLEHRGYSLVLTDWILFSF